MATHRTADKLIIADILEALQRQLAVAVGEARRRAVPAQRLAIDLYRVLRAQKVSSAKIRSLQQSHAKGVRPRGFRGTLTDLGSCQLGQPPTMVPSSCSSPGESGWRSRSGCWSNSSCALSASHQSFLRCEGTLRVRRRVED